MNKIKMNKGVVCFLIFIFTFILFFDLVNSYIPDIYITEANNLTNISSEKDGYLNYEMGFEYPGLITKIGSVDNYISYVYPNESFALNYSYNATHHGIYETQRASKDGNYVNRQINITNLFNTTVNLTYAVPHSRGSLCNYSSHWFNFTPLNYSVDANYLVVNAEIAANESQLVNTTCYTNLLSGIVHYPKTNYNISSGKNIFSDIETRLLPKSYFSVTKKSGILQNVSNDSMVRNWSIYFDLTNYGNISLNLTKIHLWSNPVMRHTGDPNENKLIDVNYSSCLEGYNILNESIPCTQYATFLSNEVPIVWGEVFFENMFNIVSNGHYNYLGSYINFSLEDYVIWLYLPKNMSIADVNETIDMTYYVSNFSNCHLYTNVSSIDGNITATGITKDAVFKNDSFDYTTPGIESIFSWNVYCRTPDGKKDGFSKYNYLVYVNGKPRIYNDTFPDFSWLEDNNLTLNLSNYFYDLENESMNFSYYPSSISNLSFIIDNVSDMLTIIPDPDWYGQRLVSLIAHDQYGRNTTSNLFYLDVINVFDPPDIVWWNLSNQTHWTTDLNTTFVENDTIRFSANATDPDLYGDTPASWFYWFLDGILQSIGKAWDWGLGWFDSGTHNVTLVVNDSEGLKDFLTWIINVTNKNRPPQYNLLEPILIKQNTSKIINLSHYFYDLDLENLNYSIVGDSIENITVNLSNITKMGYFIPDVNFIGRRYVQFNATDLHGDYNVSNNVSVVVYPYIMLTMPNITFDEDMYNDSLDLDGYYNLYYSRSDLSWGINGSNNVNVAINIISWLTNFTSKLNWYGSEEIIFMVKHVDNYTDNYTLNVVVNPINDAPIINSTSRLIIENSDPVDNFIDLWNYSYDVDNNYTYLNYSIVSNSNSTLVDCSVVDNRYINCTEPMFDRWGISYLNVSVYDGQYYDYALMNISVYHYDLSPNIVNWTFTNGSTTFKETNVGKSITVYENTWLNFTATFYDWENDDLNYYWILDGVIIDNGSFNETYLNRTLSYSKFMDFHSAGYYNLKFKLNQTAVNVMPLSSELNWDINVLNLNRRPTKPELSLPINNTKIYSLPEFFNWTSSTDPDAINHTSYDFWDVSYIFQINNMPGFELFNYQIYTEDTYFNLGANNFVDNWYYWRVFATDGDDSSSSEIRQILVDLNAPLLTLNITPNPSEFNIRNVSVSWFVYDKFLNQSYVNVTYPNGTMLGVYNSSNFILDTFDLNVMGSYLITAYSNDLAGHESVITENLLIVNDTIPPVVTLRYPSNFSKSSSSTLIFEYGYTDYSTLANCSLYYQRINQVVDVTGKHILGETDISAWSVKQTDLNIETGFNNFVVSNLIDSTYRWNVICYDLAGNYAFAKHNWTFDVKTTSSDDGYVPKDATYDSSERILNAATGYNLNALIPIVDLVPGELYNFNVTLENTGDLTINGITLKSTLNWLSFDDVVNDLNPGQKINVTVSVDAPYQFGELMYHLIIESNQVNLIKSGFFNFKGSEEIVPLKIIKTLIPLNDSYNVTIEIVNSMYSNQRFYLEDYINDMSLISYAYSDFDANIVYPPSLILKNKLINKTSVLRYDYEVSDLDISRLNKPFVVSDVGYVVELHIIDPTKTRFAFFKVSSPEYIFFSLFIAVVLIWYIYKRKKHLDNFKKHNFKKQNLKKQTTNSNYKSK